MHTKEAPKGIDQVPDKETSMSQRITRPAEVLLSESNDLAKTVHAKDLVVSGQEAQKIREAREKADRIYALSEKGWQYPDVPEYVDNDVFEDIDLTIPPASYLETWESGYMQGQLDNLRALFEAFKAKLEKENPERYGDIISGQPGRLANTDYYDANTFVKFQKKIAVYEDMLAKRQNGTGEVSQKKGKESFFGRLKKMFSYGK